MKSRVDRSTLVRSLARVRSVIEARSTMPALSHVRIEAGEDFLSLMGTDGDTWIEEKCSATVEKVGTVVVKAQKLYDIVSALPEGAELDLRYENEKGLSFRADKARFLLTDMPVESFPAHDSGKEVKAFSIEVQQLRYMLDKTAFAISDDESRYYLNGVYLHEHESAEGKKTLRAVSTDGHRLARVIVALPDKAEGIPGVILPRKAVKELCTLLADAEGEVEVKLCHKEGEEAEDLDNTQASTMEFEFATTKIKTRLIDGSFPDYERVIPTDNTNTMRFVCKSLSDRVAAVHYLSSETTHGVKFTLDKGTLHISAHHGTDGEGTYPLDVEYEGEAFEVGYNARYLLDMTRKIIPQKGIFCWKDSESAAIVKDEDDENVLFVIMPMRV